MNSHYCAAVLRSIAITIERSGHAIETHAATGYWPGDITKERAEFAEAITQMAAKFPELEAWAAALVA